MPAPGPDSPTKALETGPRSLPSPLRAEDDLSTVHLTADDVRRRITARERDIRYHLEALRHEAATVLDDVNFEGRPIADRIRSTPEPILAVAAGIGAAIGLVWGARRRAKRRPQTDEQIAFVRARLDVALDRAARHVAGGADTDDALAHAMEEMPVLYGDASKLKPPQTARQQAQGAAVSAVAGFLAKTVADLAVRRFTGADGTLDALSDASE